MSGGTQIIESRQTMTDNIKKPKDVAVTKAKGRPMLTWVPPEVMATWQGGAGDNLPHHSVTTMQLDHMVSVLGAGFKKLGIQKGDRAIVFIPMSLPMYAAMFAYGRADLIQKNVSSIIASMEGRPASFAKDFRPSLSRAWMKGFKYRFHGRADLVALVTALGKAVREYGSLQAMFQEMDKNPGSETVMEGVSGVARALRKYAGGGAPGFKTLVTDPADGGAAKRWMLFMRWMVRKDDVDPGPWEGSVDRARLVIPLDTHVGRIARFLGMLGRKSNDWKSALELTRYLKLLDPADPVRYDFAICSYGKLGYCSSRPALEKCGSCNFNTLCGAIL